MIEIRLLHDEERSKDWQFKLFLSQLEEYFAIINAQSQFILTKGFFRRLSDQGLAQTF
jgi:hypothetical protein